MDKKSTVWRDEDIRFIEGIRRDLLQLKEQGAFENRKIALIGSWINQEKIQAVLSELELKIEFIADNNPNKQNIDRFGIRTQSVDSLVHEDHLIILVSGFYSREISQQLKRLGYKEGLDYHVLAADMQQDKVKDHVINDVTWKEYKEYARRGFLAYCKLQEKYGDTPMWLMHQPSLGDLYIFSLFLPYVYGKRCISECDCVLLVARNSTRKLAEILGYKKIELITLEEASKDWLFMMRLMRDKVNVKNAVCHGLSNTFLSLVPYTNVTFRDGFVKYVLGLEGNPKPIYPEFPKRREYVKEQFEKLGLIKGRTVVISPYAGHFTPSISEEQWVTLVEGLSNKGYRVCTNCGSEDEKPLPGTVGAFVDLRDCVEFVEMAGSFIGVRSGLCDLICMAECRKSIIYEKGATNNNICFFGFEKMGLGQLIKEYDNDRVNTDSIIRDILEGY